MGNRNRQVQLRGTGLRKHTVTGTQFIVHRSEAVILPRTSNIHTVAASTQPELPGFVWDAERERYFPAYARRADASGIALKSNKDSNSDVMSATQHNRASVSCGSVCSMLLSRELRSSPSMTVAMAQAVVSSRVLQSISTPSAPANASLRDCATTMNGFDRGCAEGFLKKLKVKHSNSRMHPSDI